MYFSFINHICFNVLRFVKTSSIELQRKYELGKREKIKEIVELDFEDQGHF